MRFTDIFIKRPVLAFVVSALILLLGLRSLTTLHVRQFPLLTNTVVTVSTIYPGATSDLMQGFITTPLQQAIATADGIDYITSSSVLGASTITAYVRLNFDPDAAVTEIMSKVQQVRYLIPQGANDPVITKSTGQTTAIMYVGFSSPSLALPAISDYLNRVVQPVLATVEGVASADVIGGQTFAMRVWLDPARMAARGISAADVSAAIRANNFQTAPGQQKGYFTIANITANTDLQSVDTFREMVVKVNEGALIRLKDIATVSLDAQSFDASVSMDSQNAVFIGVQPTPAGNPLSVVSGVRKKLESIRNTLPPTLQMNVAYDASKFIQASIDDVIWTLAQAVGVVIIVIFLFLGSLRSVLIPIVTIPLSLIGAGTLMLAMGFSLNLLTLLAMVLAIGLVVDDAIVVVENVFRHIEEGKTPIQAAVIGAREIAGPVIAMTMTLAAVYAPIGLLGGVTGILFREFAFTLASAVIVSGVVALTLSPVMSSALLSQSVLNSFFTRTINRGFTTVEHWYSRRLASSLDYRPATLILALGVIASLYFLYSNATTELAPQEDQGIILGLAKGPQYANLDYMQAYQKQLEAALSLPGADGTFIIYGRPTVNQGFVGARLTPWNERTQTAQQIQPQLQGRLSRVPGLQVFTFSPPPLPGSVGGLPVQMVVYSTDGYSIIYNVMEKLKAEARKSGLFLVVDSDLAFNTPTVKVEVNRSKANELGVTMENIGNTLALMVGGNYVNRFDLQGRSYEVIPQVPRAERLTPDKLANYYVPTASGTEVPLSTLVKVSTATEPNALTQYNQLNSATFQAVPSPSVTVGQAVNFLEQQAKELFPESFSRAYLADSRQYVEEGSQLIYTFVFALIVIYLVLAAQFESLSDPIVILVSVPMSICGALLPLFLGIATVNIYSQVGLVTLIGLISKHGILMVEFAKELQRHENMDRRKAIVRAASVRLRPILMTTAAMVVGLIPMVMATGAGAASRFSIGLVIVSGLTIGTVFTLFVLPMVYTFIGADHRPATTAAREAEIASAG
ncbi:MAG: efflux RND transporter permease subunit [Rhodomicrobium sp.]